MRLRRLLARCVVGSVLLGGCSSGGESSADVPGVEDDAATAVDSQSPDDAAPPKDTSEDTALEDTAPEDDGPTCTADGKACAASSECCAGSYCIDGRCGKCDWDPKYPQFCPQLGGACWSAGIACSTVTDCGADGLWGCFESFLRYDCSTKECVCPKPEYPVYCASTDTMPAACWGAGAVCSTRVECPDGTRHACTSSGYHYDCTTKKCVSGTVTPPGPSTVPSWLVGTYSRVGKQENNVYFESDNRGITFKADGTYSQWLGKASPTTGTFKIAGDVLTFSTGALSGSTVNLKSSFDSTCRILYGFGSALWRKEEVPSCPRYAAVTASECAYVGTFTKTDESGSLSGGSGTKTSYEWTVKLGRDRFYTYDSWTFRTSCYSGSCKSLSSRIQTVVGNWSVSGGAPPWALSTLTSAPWKLTKSSAACPGP